MSEYEIWSIVIASLAVVISLVALYLSSSYSKGSLNKAEIQNLVALGTIEIAVNQSINSSRQRVEDLTLEFTPLFVKRAAGTLTADEQSTLEAFERVFNSSIESNLNCYEEACSKYLDNKLDKDRFKKTYHTEIRQLVERPGYRNYFDGVTSRYKATLKVYKEWHDLEQ